MRALLALRCLSIILLSLTLLSSCDTKSGSGKSRKGSQVLNVALSSNIASLDQAQSYDNVSAKVVYQIHEPLFEYEYLIRPYSLKPLVAKEMPVITDGGKTYTIKIKEGVFYHEHKAFSGKRELVAQDFINQIKRIAFRPTQSNGWWLFDDKIVGLNKFRKEANDLKQFVSLKVPGLQALDRHTLQIRLTRPNPQLIFALAMSFSAPAPIELIQHYKNDLSQEPIGTGPFTLKDWKKNLSLSLLKNLNYHKQTYPKSGDRIAYERELLKDAGKSLPFLDGIKFHIMKEAGPRMQNFQKGNLDFVTLTKDYFQMALNNQGKIREDLTKQGVRLQIVPTLTYWWLAFNMQDEVLGKNLKLRQAIAHAIDNEKLIKLFTNNIALKANSIFPPGVPGYDPSAELPYAYNPEKAKALLKEAGYPRGEGLPPLRYDIRGSSTTSRQMGEFIKSQLEAIGIKIEIIVNTFPGFLSKAKTGNLQFWQGGWAMDYPDAQNVIQLLASGNIPPGPNTSFYSDPVVDEIYQKIETQGTKNLDYSQAMKKVESRVNAQLPWVMQYYARDYVLYHKRLKNFRQSDLIFNSYKYLRIE